MTDRNSDIGGNTIVASLPAELRARLRTELEHVSLDKGMVLIEPDEPVTDIYFPISGLGSIIALSPEGECAEIGLFGRDGMSGQPILLGTESTPHRVLMQVGGEGYRIGADRLRDLIGESEAFRGALLRYIQALSIQTAHTALSNAHHTVEERLARWLLMSHDRMADDEVPLTHDFLALMLAVRRPSVTTALHVLEGMSLIKATRGLVTIRDRGGLEDFAQDAYGTPEAEYERLIGPLLKRR